MAEAISGNKLFITRLIIGLVQGLALYLLYHASNGQPRDWPATNGLLFGPLLLCWFFVPLLLSSALGEMRPHRAIGWAAIATAIVALLGFFDIWSAWPQDWELTQGVGAWHPHIMPSASLFLSASAGLFIAQALVVAGHADGRFMATYPRHFDVAWKLAVQLALTGLFVGVFWLLLWLGAGLFNLIKLDFFEKLIRHDWFAIPASTLAAAAALHLTDIRPALVRGARTLLLTLLSWLLPLLTLIVAGFVASLPFTGLAALWNIGHASALLLAASAVLIILINAAHQDGEADPPRILRIAGTVAAILPLPLSLIAARALFLRVVQHGWSVDRVLVAACLLVALGYAAGYVAAVASRGPWLKRIETWNFCIALFILALLLALFTPIASPARIAVADQMARLNSGKIAPGRFDFKFLRWQGGRYGKAALAVLAKSRTPAVRDMADAVQSQTNQYVTLAPVLKSGTSQVTVYPLGQKLPRAFATTNWTGNRDGLALPACITSGDAPCDAFLLDLDGDGRPEIMLIAENNPYAQIFRQGADGVWALAGTVAFPAGCTAAIEKLRQGQYEILPEERPWREIAIAGVRLHIKDAFNAGGTPACPK